MQIVDKKKTEYDWERAREREGAKKELGKRNVEEKNPKKKI